jgi:hypothetical protein
MHDCKGRPLVPGDTVLVPFKITQTYATEEYCNALLETVASMFPGTSKTSLTVNTQQVIRANDGDDASFTVTREGEATKIG